MEKISNKLFWYLSALLGFCLFALILYRSIYLSITYDEVWTYDLASQSIKDIMTAEQNIASANNHFLNSILIKPFLKLFGHHIWVLRLPNVISFILFFSGTIMLVNKISVNKLTRFCGLIAINCQLFMIDFFSLSRGYGLAISFEIVSLTMMINYIQSRRSKYIGLSFLFATFSVFSNFTWLNFLAPLILVFNFILIEENRKHNKKWHQDLLVKNIYPFIFSMIIIFYCTTPILSLRKNGELGLGANTWFNSFHGFAKDFNYSNSFAFAVIIQVVFILIFVLSIFLIWKNVKNKKASISKLFFFVSIILSIISATIVQRFFLNTMYMDGRKAIMYLPILVCIVIVLLEYYSEKFEKLISITSIAFILYFILHFFTSLNIHAVREWWFDEHANEVANYINQHPINGESSAIMDWEFGSSIQYYNRHLYDNKLKLYMKDRDSNLPKSPSYYYLFENNVPPILENYHIVQKFNNGTVLIGKGNLIQNESTLKADLK